MTLTEREAEAVDFLDALTGHYAAGAWAMFSGGDDSLAAALVAARARTFRGCLHIDTGIGVPETQSFVIETCRAQGWPLDIYRAKEYGQDYAELAVKYGFPGPAAHFRMYIRLKERALDAFVREHKHYRLNRIVLSTGARATESERRVGHAERVRRDGCKVWANPIFAWSKFDCLDTISAAGVPRNPVVELLHKSGECLCGSFAKPDELKELRCWYPKVAAHIDAIAERVKAAGHRACVWGQRPPRERKRQPAARDSAGRRVGPLCQQCELEFAASLGAERD
jgi:3'-phosphoadenosine 5'-phosphosulfate sulfotransferase (PAPS reductase)/FAD synthetase